MKLTIPVNALKSTQTGFGKKGGKLTSALILMRDPQDSLEAVTKRYIDSLFISIDASSVKQGTIRPERFPRFIGDVNKAEGSNIIELSSKNLSTANYCKINIDANGRIDSGTNLTVDDIPALSWSKVKNAAPTTLLDYGLTEALNKSGGALTGYLNLNSVPTQTLHAVNKQYADNNMSGTGGSVVGDVNVKASSATPSGYLRCNGGEVSKSTYSALYSIVGDKYSIVYNPGYGKPWKQQCNINTTFNANLGAWSNYSYFNQTLKDYQTVVTKNKVYFIGGDTGRSISSMILSADIDSFGNLPSIVNTGTVKQVGGISGVYTIPKKTVQIELSGRGDPGTSELIAEQINYRWSSMNIIKDWNIGSIAPDQGNYSVYTLFGPGGIPNSGSDVILIILYLPLYLDSNGNTLPKDTPYNSSYTVSDTLRYLIDVKYTSEQYLTPVYQNTPGEDSYVVIDGITYPFSGSPDTNSPPVYGYLIDLKSPSNGSDISMNVHVSSQGYIDIKYVNVAADKASGKSLPSEISKFQAITVKNKIHAIGGFDGVNSVSSIYTAPINADGTLGLWTTNSVSLPEGIRSFSSFCDGNYVYVIGGYTTQPSSKIYKSQVDQATGNLGAFQYIGDLPDSLYETSLAVLKNTVYILGGRNSTDIVKSVYKAKLTITGDLFTWSRDYDLPDFLTNSKAYVTSNRIYMINGTNKTGVSLKTYSALVNSNDEISTWTDNSISFPSSSEQGDFFVINGSLMFTVVSGGINYQSKSNIYKTNVTGGLNDYSLYYSGTLTLTNPNNFRLPDYTSKEAFGNYYYVKY